MADEFAPGNNGQVEISHRHQLEETEVVDDGLVVVHQLDDEGALGENGGDVQAEEVDQVVGHGHDFAGAAPDDGGQCVQAQEVLVVQETALERHLQELEVERLEERLVGGDERGPVRGNETEDDEQVGALLVPFLHQKRLAGKQKPLAQEKRQQVVRQRVVKVDDLVGVDVLYRLVDVVRDQRRHVLNLVGRAEVQRHVGRAQARAAGVVAVASHGDERPRRIIAVELQKHHHRQHGSHVRQRRQRLGDEVAQHEVLLVEHVGVEVGGGGGGGGGAHGRVSHALQRRVERLGETPGVRVAVERLHLGRLRLRLRGGVVAHVFCPFAHHIATFVGHVALDAVLARPRVGALEVLGVAEHTCPRRGLALSFFLGRESLGHYGEECDELGYC